MEGLKAQYLDLFKSIASLEGNLDLEKEVNRLKKMLEKIFKNKTQAPGKPYKCFKQIRYYPNGLCIQTGAINFPRMIILSPWELQPNNAKTKTLKTNRQYLLNCLKDINLIWFLQVKDYLGQKYYVNKTKKSEFTVKESISKFKDMDALLDTEEFNTYNKHSNSNSNLPLDDIYKGNALTGPAKKIVDLFTVSYVSYGSYMSFKFLTDEGIKKLIASVDEDEPYTFSDHRRFIVYLGDITKDSLVISRRNQSYKETYREFYLSHLEEIDTYLSKVTDEKTIEILKKLNLA